MFWHHRALGPASNLSPCAALGEQTRQCREGSSASATVLVEQETTAWSTITANFVSNVIVLKSVHAVGCCVAPSLRHQTARDSSQCEFHFEESPLCIVVNAVMVTDMALLRI